MARKTRSDARLPKLSKEQKEMLLSWLDDQNFSLKDVVRMLYAEFNIRTNRSSVSDWYSSYCFSRDVQAAAELAGNLKEELKSLPIDLDDELVSRAAQARFESLVVKDGDVKGHVALRKLRQKDRDQKLAERSQVASEEGFRLKYEQKERQLSNEMERFRFKVKDDTEKALTAFYDEIKGNSAALQAFARLKEAVEAAVS